LNYFFPLYYFFLILKSLSFGGVGED